MSIDDKVDGFWKEYTLERHNKLNYSRLEYILFLAAGIGGSVVINVLSGNPNSSPSVLDQILINAKYVWLAYSPIAALSGYSILRYRPKEDFYLERKRQSENYKVIFQITTRGFNTEAVERSIKSVLYWAPKYLKNFEIWVVTEEDVDKNFFESLKEINEEARRRVKVIYVPRDYRTPNNTKYKARALHYAMELRKKLGYDPKKTWIYLMDEESIVGEDTILGIIDFIEREAKKGKLIGQGLIVYSNFWGKNLLTSLEDSLRAGDDIGRYRWQCKYGRPVIGFHGSHLLYRFDLELKIGWDFGKVRTEDTAFAYRILQLFKEKIVGWLKGKLYEQSPFSIRDFIKQRRRWFWAVLDFILYEKLPLRRKLFLTYKLITWLSSLPSLLLLYINIFHPTPVPTPYLAVPYGVSLATILWLYWEGYKLNTEPSNKYHFLMRLVNIAAVPIIAILEGISAWYGLVTYKREGYDVIKK